MKSLGSTEERYAQFKASGDFLEACVLFLAAKGDVPLIKQAPQRGVPQRVAELAALMPSVKSLMDARITRTAVTAQNTVDQSALSQYEAAQSAFITSLRSAGCFDAMLSSMRNVPLRHSVAVSSTALVGTTLFEGQHKPVTSLSFGTKTLPERKSAASVSASTELMLLGGPSAASMLGQELRSALAYSTDDEFLGLLTTSTNAGNIFATTGSTQVAFMTDISLALERLVLDQNSRIFIIMRPSTCKSLCMNMQEGDSTILENVGLKGGQVKDMTVLTTDACPAGYMFIADANQIAANPGTVLMSMMRHGDIVGSTAPDSPNTANTVAVSLWQHGLSALLAERWYGATLLRDTGCAIVQGVSYAGDSP